MFLFELEFEVFSLDFFKLCVFSLKEFFERIIEFYFKGSDKKVLSSRSPSHKAWLGWWKLIKFDLID